MTAGTARRGGSRIDTAGPSAPPAGDSVASALVAALIDNRIDTVFGVGGTHTLVLLGAIKRAG